MRFDRSILSITFLVACLAWTLWFVFAGFGNHQDPLYWLYKYQHLEGGWMAVGTLLTGGTVVRLFGAELLPLRLVGWLCTVGAIALPYCCLQTKEQRRENLHWLALTYVLMGYGAYQEFSPGTLSVLLLSALWVCGVKFTIHNLQFKIQILSAILAGLAVSVRFPNILALLILIPLWKKRSLWLVPVSVLTAGLVYGLGYLFVTPAPLDGSMTSHELVSMLTKLWENGGKLIGYMLLAFGVVGVGEFKIHNSQFTIQNSKFKIQNYELLMRAALVGAALCYFIAYTIKPLQWYNTDLTYLISAFCLVMALTPNPLTANPLTYGTAIFMVATLGTDTAWLKLFPAVLCLLPVAASRYEKEKRRYLFVVLALMSGMVAYRMTTNSIGRCNLTQVDTICSVSPYQGIAIRAIEEQRMMQYKADYEEIHNSQCTMHNAQVLSIGQENHLMRAVTGCEAARYNEFWSNIFDSVYTAKYRPIMQEERPVVFCSFSPQFKTKPVYTDRNSVFERMLLEEGYRAIDRSKHQYMIYIPIEKNSNYTFK